MRISLIKSKKDVQSFNLAKSFGMNVVELEENEEIDEKISELISNDCTNIIITNEVAGFSEDIITKYKTSNNVKIYIAPSKRSN